MIGPKREDEGRRGAPRRAEGEKTAEAGEEAGAGDEEDMGVRARKRRHQAFEDTKDNKTLNDEECGYRLTERCAA